MQPAREDIDTPTERPKSFRNALGVGPHRYTLMIAYWFGLIGTVTFAIMYARHSWVRYEENGRARLALTTALVALVTHETMNNEASGLVFLAQRMQDMHALAHPRRARRLLMQYQKAFPNVASAELIAPNGQVMAATALPEGAKLPNFRNNPLVWRGLRGALALPGLHIHRPLHGPLVKRWVIGFSDTVFSAENKPLFLLTTPLRFRDFEGLLAHLPLSRGLAVGVLRNDFYMEGREPVPHGDLHALLTRPMTGILAQTLKRHLEARRGFFEGVTGSDAVYRYGAFVRIPGYPLIAFADVSRALWLQKWWQEQIKIPLIFLLLALAFSGFSYRRIQVLTDRWEQERDRQRVVLQGLVTHDPLTGLWNRKGFYTVFRNALMRAKRDGRMMAIGFLDVDDFKSINDNYGHIAGDLVLQQLATKLKENLRQTDHVARLGGDEFILLIEGLRVQEDVYAVIENLRAGLTGDFIVDGHALPVHVSLGLALYPLNGANMGNLVQQADQAMYVAKSRKPEDSCSWIKIYDPSMPPIPGKDVGKGWLFEDYEPHGP